MCLRVQDSKCFSHSRRNGQVTAIKPPTGGPQLRPMQVVIIQSQAAKGMYSF